MIGYIFMFLAALIVLPLIFAMMRGRGARGRGQTDFGPHPPVQHDEPAADEPTPDVTTPKERDGASRIPPS